MIEVAIIDCSGPFIIIALVLGVVGAFCWALGLLISVLVHTIEEGDARPWLKFATVGVSMIGVAILLAVFNQSFVPTICR